MGRPTLWSSMMNRKVSTAAIQVFCYLLNNIRWSTFVLSDVHSGLKRNCVFFSFWLDGCKQKM
jgi:hypothetical protein